MTGLKAKGTIFWIRKIVVMAIVAEAFFIALSPLAAEGAMLVGLVFFLLRLWLDDEFHYRRTVLFKPIVLFMLCGGASILVSPDKFFSFYNYYNLAGVYLCTYVLVTQNVRTRDDVYMILKALAGAAVLVLLYGFYQFLFGIDTSQMKWVDGNAFPELRKRIFSTWENPNIFAGYLDILLCVLLGIITKLDDIKIRKILAGCMLVAFFCLTMTYARGALLTIAVIMAGYGVMKDRRVLYAVVAVSVLALLVSPVLMERVTNMFNMSDTSSEMRLAMWESTISMIIDHPLLGIGWGAYWMVYPIYDFYIVDGSVTLVHAHNIYLNYMAEIGIVGGISFFVYFFTSMKMALVSKIESESKLIQGVLFGLGLSLISVALNGITDDVLFNIPSSMLLWMMCGLIVVILEKYSNVKTKQQ